ncbi:peptidase M23 [Streptomyces tsukubensis]|uniref:Peptidase M23 n=1 Tax=Streptomyces tsukubensis TaxID=83656 RepID=A0A1V4A9U9_9ACTN|nr:peptidase M23 [Streptomyces tsukubensis]
MLVPALCVLLGAGALPTVPLAGAAEHPAGTSAEVARLYEEASAATQRYESGRRLAAAQRVRARKAEARLGRQRHRLRLLRGDVGKLARAQYRQRGGLPGAAYLLLADDPATLLRGKRITERAEMSMKNIVRRAQRAEHKLTSDEREAARTWRGLSARTAELAVLKKGIKRKLENAQWKLQGEAEAAVAAGQCRGAERMAQDTAELPKGRRWVAPVETYELSAGFGGAGAMWASSHTGQDFAVDIGTPVRSMGPGRVEQVSCGGAFGIEVVVRHPGGYYSQYAHLSSAAVDQGERLRAGQWIGQSGTTGNSTGPHLHFEVRLTPYLGSGVDPLTWFAERGVRL